MRVYRRFSTYEQVDIGVCADAYIDTDAYTDARYRKVFDREREKV